MFVCVGGNVVAHPPHRTKTRDPRVDEFRREQARAQTLGRSGCWRASAAMSGFIIFQRSVYCGQDMFAAGVAATVAGSFRDH